MAYINNWSMNDYKVYGETVGETVEQTISFMFEVHGANIYVTSLNGSDVAVDGVIYQLDRYAKKYRNSHNTAIVTAYATIPFEIKIDSYKPRVVARITAHGHTRYGTYEESENKIFLNKILVKQQGTPSWITPITNHAENCRITYTDINRISQNTAHLKTPVARWNFVRGDFVEQNEWDGIINKTNEMATELEIPQVSTSTGWRNINQIETIHKLYKEAQDE